MMSSIEFAAELPYFEDDFIFKILEYLLNLSVDSNQEFESDVPVNEACDLLTTMCLNPYVSYKIIDFLTFMVYLNGA